MSNKQDLNGVRTAQDLERKYDFAALLGLKKNVEIQLQTLTKLQNELNNFIEVTVGDIENLQEQIDGKITTWYYEGVPTLNNIPASEWSTDDEKAEHIGDLYYDKSTGYAYRFQFENNVYSWLKIVDQDVTEALALAGAAQDTADSKRQIFLQQPTVPYDNGDLWIDSNEIFICQVSRHSGNFNSNDWINNLKYTDDTVAEAIVDELGGTTTTVLHGQVVTQMAEYTKFTDLATGGSTTIAGENITTGKIKSQNYVKNVSGMQIDLSNGKIDTKNTKWDEYGNIQFSNGADVINDKGVFTTIVYEAEAHTFHAVGIPMNLLPLGWNYNDPSSPMVDIDGNVIIGCYPDFALFDIKLPSDFTIVSAKVYISHIPFIHEQFGGTTYTGATKNLQLYSCDKDSYRKITTYGNILLKKINETLISGAFGSSNGFNGNTTSRTDAMSIDVSDYIKNGKLIELKSNANINNTVQACAEATGGILAKLIVTGYIKL